MRFVLPIGSVPLGTNVHAALRTTGHGTRLRQVEPLMSCANAEGAIPSFVVYGMQRNSADEVHKNAVRLLRESTLLSSPNLMSALPLGPLYT